jgi:BirA family biotin operon repressor/biotin-[acetyl-CoA-carboxylase] ligase
MNIAPQDRAAALTALPGVAEVHWYDSVESTNSIAMALGVDGKRHGTVVLAGNQSAGRGRAGRRWYSPKGNLYMSVIWRPPWLAEKAPQVTLEVATAVARAIHSATNRRPDLRWPNDVLIDGKKCCGVLTELRTRGPKVDFIVVGIGVNVSAFGADLPAELSHIATSLSEVSDRPIDAMDFARMLLSELNSSYQAMLARGNFDREGWLNYAETIGAPVTVSPPGESPFEATSVDIDAQGLLIVELATGERLQVIAGDVRVREVH